MHGLTGGGWKRKRRPRSPRVGRPGRKLREYRPWDLPTTTPPRLPPTLLRPGVSYATFAYLSDYLWHAVWRWLFRKHPKTRWKEIRRRNCRVGSWPATVERSLFNPVKVGTTRYRYRGAAIPTPWPTTG